MPANVITINGSKTLEWVVPDSKMDVLLALLDGIGEARTDEAREAAQKARENLGTKVSMKLFEGITAKGIGGRSWRVAGLGADVTEGGTR